MSEKNDAEKNKEVENMALAQRCNRGFIIATGQEKAFLKKVNDNRPTEEFWSDCKRLRQNINQDSIDAINKLMDQKD